MGATVSTFKQPKAPTNPISPHDPTPPSSIIELLRPECLKVKKKKKKKQQQQQQQRLLPPQGKKLTEAETLTLEECLLASPGFDQVFSANADVGKICKPSRVRPSRLGPVDLAASPLKARDSLSLERPANTHMEIQGKCPSEVCNTRRSENRGSGKTVRFRLPQETDIILFYSPQKRLECDEESVAEFCHAD